MEDVTGGSNSRTRAESSAGSGSALFESAGWIRVALVAATLGLASCASTPRQATPPRNGYCIAGHGCYRVLATARGYQARGTASWYGEGDAGRPTASGVPFDPRAMRIAHKTLPFGTWVRIRDLHNGREAIAMVDDRGPFVDGRVVDATPAVARRLGYYLDGTAPVRVSTVPLADLSAAQRQAARADERSAIDYAHRHPHGILAEAGHVAVRGVVDITSTGVRIGVGIVRIGLHAVFDVVKLLL